MKIKNQFIRFWPIHFSAFLFFLLILLIQLPSKAQSLIVLETNGKEYAFSFNNLNKISFLNDQLWVDRTNGTINSYELNALRSLRFTENSINTSLEELVLDESLVRMYPNPTKNLLHVEWMDAADYTIEIVSFSGKSCLKVFVETGRHEMALEGLPSGLYLCRVSNGKQQISKKFIKN